VPVRSNLVKGAVLLVALAGVAVLPAAAATSRAGGTHRLIVAVKKTLAPAAEKKLAVLVLVSRNGGAPAGAVATAGRPLTVLQSSSGPYLVRVEIDAACKGRCEARYRISGSADHRLEVVPSCRTRGSGFVCSRVQIVRVY
jgi:hypothetical protein